MLFVRRMISTVYLMRHPQVPAQLKLLPVWAFLYLIWPRDIIFDYRAFPLGFLDDIVIGLILNAIFTARAWAYAFMPRRGGKTDYRKNAVKVDFRVVDEEEKAESAGKSDR